MKVSLIIPLRDEAASVVPLLESIAGQSRRPDEVVVVDAGSTDGTRALVTTFGGPLPIRLVPAGKLFPGLARNAGAELAAHDWFAFTDGGVRLAPRWLEELVTSAESEVADAVFGSFDPICDTLFQKCAAVAYVPGPGAQGIRGPSVTSMVLKREAFERAGRFPPFRASEDLIFIERLLALPLHVAYAPRAVVYWELASDAGRTFRRFALYSEHNLRAGRGRYWHRGVLRHYVLMTFFAAGLFVVGAGPWGLAVYPFWQVARAGRSAWQKRKAFEFRAFAPSVILGAAALLCLIDAATLAGTIAWLKRRGAPA
ncbi:MAG TPA: glycosyltransferase [Vicinamibacteria bacterium]|nr:glycosyltransferase [Vicinamibacteria bacterium]